MNYRLGVTKHLKGGSQGYSPKAHNLITVFEINKGYRSIPIDGVVSITKAKEKLIVS